MICSFCDVSSELAPRVNQKLIVGLEEWQGLALAGNGLSGLLLTDIPLVDNRKDKFEKIPTSVYLSGIAASQTRPGLSDLAHRMMSWSFHHRRGD